MLLRSNARCKHDIPQEICHVCNDELDYEINSTLKILDKKTKKEKNHFHKLKDTYSDHLDSMQQNKRTRK